MEEILDWTWIKLNISPEAMFLYNNRDYIGLLSILNKRYDVFHRITGTLYAFKI